MHMTKLTKPMVHEGTAELLEEVPTSSDGQAASPSLLPPSLGAPTTTCLDFHMEACCYLKKENIESA